MRIGSLCGKERFAVVKTSKSLKLRWGVGDWKTTSWYISSYFIGIGGRGYLFIMIIKSHFDTDKLFETTEGAWIEDLCHPQVIPQGVLLWGFFPSC